MIDDILGVLILTLPALLVLLGAMTIRYLAIVTRQR